jgi:hypothetical protein
MNRLGIIALAALISAGCGSVESIDHAGRLLGKSGAYESYPTNDSAQSKGGGGAVDLGHIHRLLDGLPAKRIALVFADFGSGFEVEAYALREMLQGRGWIVRIVGEDLEDQGKPPVAAAKHYLSRMPTLGNIEQLLVALYVHGGDIQQAIVDSQGKKVGTKTLIDQLHDRRQPTFLPL